METGETRRCWPCTQLGRVFQQGICKGPANNLYIQGAEKAAAVAGGGEPGRGQGSGGEGQGQGSGGEGQAQPDHEGPP